MTYPSAGERYPTEEEVRIEAKAVSLVNCAKELDPEMMSPEIAEAARRAISELSLDETSLLVGALVEITEELGQSMEDTTAELGAARSWASLLDREAKFQRNRTARLNSGHLR